MYAIYLFTGLPIDSAVCIWNFVKFTAYVYKIHVSWACEMKCNWAAERLEHVAKNYDLWIVIRNLANRK